jgi:hypothetical protein
VPAGENLPGNNVDCAGLASVDLDAAGDAKLTFDDGNALVSSALDVSAALLAHGAVWVSYLDSFAFDCPYCGGRTQRRLEVRAGAGGELLVFGVDGEIAQTVPKVVNDEVFGAPLEAVPQCEYEFDLDCSHVKRMPLDTVVKSTPEQTILHGVPSETTSAAGARFRVTIARSQDARSAIQGCNDGRTPPADTTFYAERLSELE